MTIAAIWLFIKGSRNAQVALLVIALGVAAMVALRIHDNAVRKADRATITAKATKLAEKAAKGADESQIERQETFNASQAELRNVSAPDDYLVRLRAVQCKANPARCR